jgi:hypothetical protein
VSGESERRHYDVKVEGGKGAVIGDYATVVQNFGQAPAALSSHIRTREFTALVEERTRSFVGREYVFDAIDMWLEAEDFPSGYLVVRGEPGIGKTAVVAQLVKRRGLVHHFNVAPLGIRSAQAFLANVCAQLIVRYDLDHAALPPEATQDGGFLSRLLAEASDEAAHHPIIVAVDALDETEDVGLPAGANRLFLPPSLPTGVYFVVSTRARTDDRLWVDRRQDFYLADDDPRNLDDVRAYIREQISADEARLQPRIELWGVSEDEFVDVLTTKSDGNFMYLVHVLRDIASGTLTHADVDDIDKLPHGLRNYYRRHWNDMRSADQERFRRYEQPVVCLLATAREPVSLAQLLEWATLFWQRQDWDPRALDPIAVRDVLSSWREFLNQEVVDGESRYRVYHASFQDFLAEEVGLVAYHESIGDAALSRIPGFGTTP